MNFFIKKDSTLPELKFLLTNKLREEYNISNDMLEDVAITFSMINADTGLYEIANVGADITYYRNKPEYPDVIEYALIYKFKLHQTCKIGRFIGEFKIDFLGEQFCCSKITLPTDEKINIIIGDSITKTSIN